MIKTIKGNFSKVAQSDGKFPLDADTFENLQNNTTIISALGAALGKGCVILSGCAVSGNRRGEGYVYVKLSEPDTGEILYYPGGNSNEPNCYVKAEPMDVTAKGESFAAAYTVRTLANGLPSNGETKLLWGDFKIGSEIFAQKSHTHTISEVNELQTELDNKVSSSTYNEDKKQSDTKISNLQKAVASPSVTFIKGMIMMWSGTVETIPKGWLLCDGNNGTPNLHEKFIMGSIYNRNHPNEELWRINEYDDSPKHLHKGILTLTDSDIPAHSHLFSGDDRMGNGSNSKRYGTDSVDCGSAGTGSGYNYLTDNYIYSWSGELKSKDTKKNIGFKTETSTCRPPFYCLAFIMYIGV